jgi:hypothetical protein
MVQGPTCVPLVASRNRATVDRELPDRQASVNSLRGADRFLRDQNRSSLSCSRCYVISVPTTKQPYLKKPHYRLLIL